MSLPVPPPYPPASALPANWQQPVDAAAVTKDEFTMAMLAPLLQVFSGFIGPLIIFIVKKDSKFVKYHSLQGLLWQAAYVLIGIGAMVIFFIFMFSTIAHTPPGAPHQPGQ